MKIVVRAAFLAALSGWSISTSHAQAVEAETAAPDPMSVGEVKKVDNGTGKITIKHGPLRNIGMDAMTMVFRVRDPAMLGQVKAGDTIRFIAEASNGQLTVTQLEKQQ